MSEITIGSIWADNGKRDKGRKFRVGYISAAQTWVRVDIKKPGDRKYGDSGKALIAFHRLNKKGGYRKISNGRAS